MTPRSAIAALALGAAALGAAVNPTGAGAQTTLEGASACMNEATRMQQQLEARATAPAQRRDAMRMLDRARDHAEGGDVGACEEAIAEARKRLAGAEPGAGDDARDTAKRDEDIPAVERPDSVRGLQTGSGAPPSPADGSTTAERSSPQEDVVALVQEAGLTGIEGAVVGNDDGDEIGEVRKVVEEAGGAETFLVVGIGGFLGLGEREVALPLGTFLAGDEMLVLPGYSREALETHPPYDQSQYTELDMRGVPRPR